MPQLGLLQQINLLQYPELIVAALLGLVMIGGRASRTVPQWLASPAVAALSALPERYVRWLATCQLWSGWRSNTAFSALASIKIYLPILFILSGLLLPLWVVPLLATASFLLPDAVVFILSRRRRQRIRESLPQALDLMVLCVDAGLGLDATLKRIASETSAVSRDLNDEMLVLSRDILLGMDREKAYLELYNRTGVEELRALGASLNQAANLGISIAKILRNQSDFLRSKLSQRAEEKAAKLPIYMAFPLWFCIMPALMVILLAPSFIIFFEYMRPLMFR